MILIATHKTRRLQADNERLRQIVVSHGGDPDEPVQRTEAREAVREVSKRLVKPVGGKMMLLPTLEEILAPKPSPKALPAPAGPVQVTMLYRGRYCLVMRKPKGVALIHTCSQCGANGSKRFATDAQALEAARMCEATEGVCTKCLNERGEVVYPADPDTEQLGLF